MNRCSYKSGSGEARLSVFLLFLVYLRHQGGDGLTERCLGVSDL